MYSLTQHNIAIQHGIAMPNIFNFDRSEWETFSDADVATHFQNIHAMLLDRLVMIGNDLHVVTENEDKELQFMLETVLHAKRYVQDRQHKG